MMTETKEIHVTDMQSFCTCRRRWDWSSRLRRGLQPALAPEPLFLGQGVHVALDKYYQLPYEERTIYHIEDYFTKWVHSRRDAIKKYKGSLWESDRNLLASTLTLGKGMLKHYHLWAYKRDGKYEVVDTEVRFEIPLPTDPATTLAGRFDGIIKDKSTGKLYLLEFKTARSIANTSWSLRSLQGSVYTIAARQLYGPEVSGIIYRILRKKVPSDPKPLKRGGFSQAISQDTSYEWFRHKLIEYRTSEWYSVVDISPLGNLLVPNSKILNHLLANENKFFYEKILKKTKSQLENAKAAVLTLSHEMVGNPVIFAMPGMYCSWCSFKEPCDLVEYGMEKDAEALLLYEYGKRDYVESKND